MVPSSRVGLVPDCCSPIRPRHERHRQGDRDRVVRSGAQVVIVDVDLNEARKTCAQISAIVGKLLENGDYAHGWNAQTGEYGDLYKWGVIDPAKVVRVAIEDAASVAGLLITTEAMIAEKPKKEVPLPAAPGGMDF